MNSITLILTIASVFIVLGLIVGYMVAYLLISQKQTSRENLQDAAHIWRDRVKGALVLEVEGKLLRSASELDNRQRILLTELSNELRAWLGLLAEPAKEKAAPPLVMASLTQQNGSGLNNGPIPVSGEPAKSMSLNPIDVFVRAINSPTPVKPVPMSIGAQIDAILQKKLETSPLKNKAIRLLELPEKGLVVLVGLDQYEDINSVPDAEIRDLIRACVAEWESQVVGGKASQAN